MRDAAGEPPDRFHLLRLAQPQLEPLALGLRELALGDVAEVHDHGLHAGFMEQVPHGRLDPAPRPVLVPYLQLGARHVVGLLQQLRPAVDRMLRVVRMYEVSHRLLDQLPRRETEHPFDRWAGVDDAPVRAHQQNALGALLDHGPKGVLTPLQHFRGPLALGHVDGRTEILGDVTGAVKDGAGDAVAVPYRSVG